MSKTTIRHSVVESLAFAALAVIAWPAVAQAGPTPTPTLSPHYCEIDIKCSDESGEGPKDDYCYVVPMGDITFYYDFIGGEAEITDSQLGVIGIYTGTTLTRTVTYYESVTHTATFEPIGTVCSHGIFSDSVTVVHGQPTPTSTSTPTATSTATSTPTSTVTSTPTATSTATSIFCLGCADCLCEVQNINPNQVVLQNVGTGGKGADSTRKMVMIVQAVDAPGATCDAGEFSEPDLRQPQDGR